MEGEKTKKVIDAIFHSTVRDLLDRANEYGINKDNFVSIFEHDGLLFLIFEKEVKLKPKTPEESD